MASEALELSKHLKYKAQYKVLYKLKAGKPEIIQNIMEDIERLYGLFCGCTSIATDSRKISGGEMFFALKGENFDGNDYVPKALDAGAAYAVADISSVLPDDPRIIKVDDTLAVLAALALHHRRVLADKGLVVIGITGTNGKTTTKELIRAVLSSRYRVSATTGNLNNDIGVPLTLLSISPDTEIAVVEMGASHPDDIAKLVKICEPDYGLITNVGKAHLQGFGSIEGVRKAKGALYDYIAAHGKAVFVNADDPGLMQMAKSREGLSVVPYGCEYDGFQVLPATPESPFLTLVRGGALRVDTSLIGEYNRSNVLAAMCVGRYFEIPEKESAVAIKAYVPSNSRSQLIRTGRNVVIADAYNANPTSMSAAIANFNSIEADKKALLLGDMRELGAESVHEHEIILEKAVDSEACLICLVGSEFGKALDNMKDRFPVSDTLRWYGTSSALAKALEDEPISGYTILLKGSRGIMMEKCLPVL